MPARLRPTAPIAAAAILVGDPGRALLLAQELLEQPKMSNHARGLWGYSGLTASGGEELTIQATGMGGPSAAMVLADLAELGVRRAVRIGTCAAAGTETALGELLLADAAIGAGASAASFGVTAGAAAHPDSALCERLAAELGEAARPATIASFDSMPSEAAAPDGAAAADMQTLAVLARGRALGIATAALLIVTEAAGSPPLEPERAERIAADAGRAASKALSNPQVEG